MAMQARPSEDPGASAILDRQLRWSYVRRQWGVPSFVLGLSLALTGAAAGYVFATARSAEGTRFANLVQDGRDQATHSFDRYMAVLRGTVGLYAADGRVDRGAFEAYSATLHLTTDYGGLHGLGFAARLPRSELERFRTAVRSNLPPPPGAVANLGTDDPFRSGNPGDAFAVQYVTPPTGRLRPVIGFDMASDPPRRAAMRQACDTAEAATTPGLLLVADGNGHRWPGFLIYVPVYASPLVPPTVDARRRAVVGFVFASFRSGDLFPQLVNHDVSSQVRMRVTEASPPAVTPDVYDSTGSSPDPASFRPRLHDRYPLQLGEHAWDVAVSERPDFRTGSDATAVPLVLLGGGGVSLILFAVSRGQAVARAEAERAAAVHRLAQRALAASQSRLRRLVDANLIGVFFCDLGGEVSGGNDEFFRLLGQPRGGDGRPLWLADLTVPQGRPRVEQALRQLGQDGSSPAFETAFTRAGGDPVPVLLGVASVHPPADRRDGRGAPPAVDPIPGAEAVAFALDLSDRHRAEHDLRQAMAVADQARDAAERANRSKDQFLAMLSHELRTPLTPVLAATAGAGADPSLPPAVRDDLVMIHRNVELEARLIDDLLDLTRIGRGKLQLRTETVDVHRVVADAVAVVPVEDLAGKGLYVEQLLSAAAHHVHGDPARLQQVFWNLVKNAVKFTPEGGRIAVRTSNGPAVGGSADGRPDAPPPPVRIEVSDTGVGIEPDVLGRVFDAFEQGSTARAQASGGLGLGLAISRGLVEAHGGRIAAESPGVGRGGDVHRRAGDGVPAGRPAPRAVAGRAGRRERVAGGPAVDATRAGRAGRGRVPGVAGRGPRRHGPRAGPAAGPGRARGVGRPHGGDGRGRLGRRPVRPARERPGPARRQRDRRGASLPPPARPRRRGRPAGGGDRPDRVRSRGRRGPHAGGRVRRAPDQAGFVRAAPVGHRPVDGGRGRAPGLTIRSGSVGPRTSGGPELPRFQSCRRRGLPGWQPSPNPRRLRRPAPRSSEGPGSPYSSEDLRTGLAGSRQARPATGTAGPSGR